MNTNSTFRIALAAPQDASPAATVGGAIRRPPFVSFERPDQRGLTTDELAVRLGLSPQTLRKRFSQTGSYFNVRPLKLPNRRLLWPADALEQLIRG